MKRGVEMKKRILCLLICSCFILLTGCQNTQEEKKETNGYNEVMQQGDGKILIVYFSRYGNTDYPEDIDTDTSASVIVDQDQQYGTTEYMARIIQEELAADIQFIKTEQSYTIDFDELRKINHDELDSGYLPELVNSDLDIGKYDTIFVGYPIWAGSVPQAIQSFLAQYDLQGKTIIPFCTHDGYGAGSSYQDIQAVEPNATLLEGLSIEASEVGNAKETVETWLETLGFDNTYAEHKEETAIRIEVNGNILEGVLYGSALADEIKVQLPLTVTMKGYGGREFYGGIDFTPQYVEEGQLFFADGDITYCPKNNTLAIFYSQSDIPNLSMEVIPVGKVISDLSIFSELPSNVDITFTLQ